MRLSVVALFAFATMAIAVPSLQVRTSCNSKQFWYSSRNCCLDRGGPSSKPNPPKGRDCPNDYYWHTGQGCCTPRNEPKKDQPEPQCQKSGWKWKKSTQCCEEDDHPNNPNPPTTSPRPQNPGKDDKDCDDNDKNKKNSHKREVSRVKKDSKSRDDALCPSGLEACPILGLTPGQYECVSPSEDIRACGGCPSLGKGQDCTTIEEAFSVSCEIGTCVVHSCHAGFKLGFDGKSCVAAI